MKSTLSLIGPLPLSARTKVHLSHKHQQTGNQSTMSSQQYSTPFAARQPTVMSTSNSLYRMYNWPPQDNGALLPGEVFYMEPPQADEYADMLDLIATCEDCYRRDTEPMQGIEMQ